MRLACKTTGAAVPALIGLLRAQHPYALPQLVVQVLQASVEYAQWVHCEVVVPASEVQT